MTGTLPEFRDPQGQPVQPDGLDAHLKGFGQMLVGQERIPGQQLLQTLLSCLFLSHRTHSTTYF